MKLWSWFCLNVDDVYQPIKRMKVARSSYSHDEIEARMQNLSFIRECSRRLLKLDPQLQMAKQNLPELMKHFRFLFVSSWDCELDRVAACNTFSHTATYLDTHCDLMFSRNCPNDQRMCQEVMNALAVDITANVYERWIQRLCGNVRPQCTILALAKPRVVQIPQTPWATAYKKDALIESLETLYARYYPRDGQEPLLLVRLNGERVPCGAA